MIKHLLKTLFVLITAWLMYVFITIFNFPIGKLTDNAQAAIVLGAAVSNGKPSPVFAERLKHAINLYHNGGVKKLVFTGGIGKPKEKAESVVAREYAMQNKVNPEDIFIETLSLTTNENLINAKEILERENLTKVLIISDSLHLKRAMLMANDLKIDAKPSATPTSRYQSLKTKLPFTFRELYFYHHFLLFSE